MKNLSKIPKPDTTAVLFIDVQEKLVAAMPEIFRDTLKKQKIFLDGAKALRLDVVVTEQYPKGLGATLPELSSIFEPKWPVLEKASFSALVEPAVRSHLERNPPETLVIAGIEAHVCVFQTALDSLAKGWSTIVLADAVESRNDVDKRTALAAAAAEGAKIWTVESLLFALTRDSGNPAFKTISKLVR